MWCQIKKMYDRSFYIPEFSFQIYVHRTVLEKKFNLHFVTAEEEIKQNLNCVFLL